MMATPTTPKIIAAIVRLATGSPTTMRAITAVQNGMVAKITSVLATDVSRMALTKQIFATPSITPAVR